MRRRSSTARAAPRLLCRRVYWRGCPPRVVTAMRLRWQMAMAPTRPLLGTAPGGCRCATPAPSVIDVLSPRTNAPRAMTRIAAAHVCVPMMDLAEALRSLTATLPSSTDEVALFAAVFAQYQVATRERLELPAADQAKLSRYIRAYTGSYKALLAKYLETMRGR